MVDTHYNQEFYSQIEPGSLRSARIIVPFLLELVKPQSVLDVGCGTGAWLKIFQENGVSIVHGLDGDYVDQSKLLIDKGCFTPTDLSKPFVIRDKYDLAITLEVAEHLPTRTNRQFVRTLTSAAPLVLFSAAIPGQGGTDHRNEQWPDYWKSIFADYGYRKLDPVRPRIWDDTRIAWWYRQNIYLYASDSAIASSPLLQKEMQATEVRDMQLTHIDVLSNTRSFRGVLTELPRSAWRAIKNRLVG